MAIKPGSDIVLDVLRAADPVREQATTQRLSALGAGGVDAPEEFSKALDAAQKPPAVQPASAADAGDMRDRLPGVDGAAAADLKAAKTKVEFEASILKTFVDEMMPKNETDVYGEGTAGDIWKSMLSDQIATQIARSGAFGIAKQLFATHPLTSPASALASSALSDAAASGAMNDLDAGYRHGASISRVSNPT
jgi:Rod binding domain-containing protein